MLVNPLSLTDFTLDGEYGSQGAVLEQVGINHFRLTLGTAPNHPTWTNRPQFILDRNAKGNRLKLDVISPVPGGGHYPMNEYNYSWSYDNEHWHPIRWEGSSPETNTFLFPEFTEDVVYFGHQVPFSPEHLERLADGWRDDPRVTVHELGRSLGGRPVYRFEITDPGSKIARNDRGGHYVVNTHPGEHNAQWRIIGMMHWLLNDPQAVPFLERTICHFVVMMCPDGPSHGWYRVNEQGVDLNRSYSLPAADEGNQAHESYICQRDLERLIAAGSRMATVWSMHTWEGAVEPILNPGPESDAPPRHWSVLRELMQRNDPHGYVRPLHIAEEPLGKADGWNGGPQRQFGGAGVLCEGGGALLTKEENLASGEVIMRSLADFYR
ncbi:M14 family zinc carboxypeptidase [Paenibacillus hodogayensis]|uniref:M14 family zinc carboxypeptidase n=1 Tax=Paenibacillus hodogayensis TaxID=279208 RepID=A0ABV5VXY5_9BACL